MGNLLTPPVIARILIQADAFTTSGIATVIVAAITSNLRLATAPGNRFVAATESRLPRDAVVNVSQIITLDKALLDEYVGHLTTSTLTQVEEGIRLVLNL